MARTVAAAERRRFLGMDRDVAFWVLAIVGLIVLGVVLDLLWGSL